MTDSKQHSTLAQARLALSILSKSQHMNGDHPVVVLGDCLDGLEEQLEAARFALDGSHARGYREGVREEQARAKEQLEAMTVSRDAWRSDAEVFQDERDGLKEQLEAAQREIKQLRRALEAEVTARLLPPPVTERSQGASSPASEPDAQKGGTDA